MPAAKLPEECAKGEPFFLTSLRVLLVEKLAEECGWANDKELKPLVGGKLYLDFCQVYICMVYSIYKIAMVEALETTISTNTVSPTKNKDRLGRGALLCAFLGREVFHSRQWGFCLLGHLLCGFLLRQK